MKDHNFVPFNQFARVAQDTWEDVLVDRPEGCQCIVMFAPEKGVSGGFLGYGFSVGRNTFKIARFVLPTGCIQEVYVINGENALEAIQRWQEAADLIAENAFTRFLATPTRSMWNEYCRIAYLSGFDATMCGRLLS